MGYSQKTDDGDPTEVVRFLAHSDGWEPCRTEPWKTVLRRDPCAYCGAYPCRTVDHIVPVYAGAAKSAPVRNATGACRACNKAKGHRSLLEFLSGLDYKGDSEYPLVSEYDVLEVLEVRGEAEAAVIAEDLGVLPRQVYPTLAQMAKDGVLKQVGKVWGCR